MPYRPRLPEWRVLRRRHLCGACRRRPVCCLGDGCAMHSMCPALPCPGCCRISLHSLLRIMCACGGANCVCIRRGALPCCQCMVPALRTAWPQRELAARQSVVSISCAHQELEAMAHVIALKCPSVSSCSPPPARMAPRMVGRLTRIVVGRTATNAMTESSARAIKIASLTDVMEGHARWALGKHCMAPSRRTGRQCPAQELRLGLFADHLLFTASSPCLAGRPGARQLFSRPIVLLTPAPAQSVSGVSGSGVPR